MLSKILTEFNEVIMKQPKLQSIIGEGGVIFGVIFLAQMYLLDDANAVYKSLGAVVIGLSFTLSSYITSTEPWADKWRYRIVSIGGLIGVIALLRGDGIQLYDLFVRKE